MGDETIPKFYKGYPIIFTGGKELREAEKREKMDNIRKILTAIIDGDCKILIAYLSEKEIKENRVETNLGDYECIGEYETDARYVYPNREHLIITVLRKLLKENNEHGLTALSFLRKFSKEIEK